MGVLSKEVEITMNLRKINAIISMLIVVLLFDHAIFYSVVMLSRYRIAAHATVLPWVITILVVIHAILSIAMAVLGHKGTENRKCNMYNRLNAKTMLQRYSGLLMIVLLVVHIVGSGTHFQPKMLHAVLHPIFFAVVLMHLAVSMSKAFITLGIGNAKLVKVFDVVMPVVCCIIFAAAVVGFYLCLFLGVVR